MKKVRIDLVLYILVFALIDQGVQASDISFLDTRKNIVMEPPYSEQKKDENKEEDKEIQPEKFQYDPVTENLPLLQERKREKERIQGVEYEQGTEVSVSFVPDFVPKEEDIHEEIPKPEEPSPDESQ